MVKSLKIKKWKEDLGKLQEEINEIRLDDNGEERTDLSKSEYKKISGLLDSAEELAEMIKTEERLSDKYSYQREIPRDGGFPGLEARQRKSGVSYRSLFGEGAKSNFKSFNEFFKAINQGYDPRLETKNFDDSEAPIILPGEKRADMAERPESLGGFLLPTEYGQVLWDAVLEDSIVMSRAQVKPMKTRTKIFPAWGIGTHAEDLYDGIIAYFTSEGGSFTESEPKTRSVELNLKKLGIYAQINDELLEDSEGSDNSIQEVLKNSLKWYMDYYLINGVGASQPLGLINSKNIVRVSGETGQASDTLKYSNIKKIFARMLPACRKNSVWICNDDCLPCLTELAIPVGTGGTIYQVMKETGGGQFSIFGRPVLFSEKMPKIGDQDCIVLVDLSQYLVGIRSEIQIAKSIHVGFSTGKTTYRVVVRFDAQMIQNEALTPAKSSDTLSSIVGIEAI